MPPNLLELVRGPWPWWVGGIAVGAVVPLLLFLANRHFGISSNLRHLCAACLPRGPSFFRYDWRKEAWSLFLAAGIVLGGWLARAILTCDPAPRIGAAARELGAQWHLAAPAAPMPLELFSWGALATPRGILFMVVGGFLVGFGARWANGCTSGHAIMGLSLRRPASLVAVIGFFIGGLTVAWVVLPAVLR
jgi:uncharacterized membrane protein YedE/YeeE